MKKIVTIIDPPSGWKYGFPKPVPDNYRDMTWEKKEAWLISEGYPKLEIERCGNHFYCRYWEQEI